MIFTITFLVFVVLTGLPLPLINQSNQNLNIIDSGILWLENHSVTATAMGIFVTIVLFLIQQLLKHKDDIRKTINQRYEYLYGLYTETLTRKDLFKHNRVNENGAEIFDFEFPNEVYDKTPLAIQMSVDKHAFTIIKDFYENIRRRNKLYSYRMDVLISNIRDYNSYVTPFVTSLDEKINTLEDIMLENNELLIELLTVNLEIITKERESILTKLGWRFTSID